MKTNSRLAQDQKLYTAIKEIYKPLCEKVSFEKAVEVSPLLKEQYTKASFHNLLLSELIEEAVDVWNDGGELGCELRFAPQWKLQFTELRLRVTLSVPFNKKHAEKSLENSGFYIKDALHDFTGSSYPNVELAKGTQPHQPTRFLGTALTQALSI